jgi:hypothetical protein
MKSGYRVELEDGQIYMIEFTLESLEITKPMSKG